VIERKGFENFPIEEVHVLFTWENLCFCMTLLKDGMAEFYWNMQRLCSNNKRNLIDEICFSDR
jgi:hypothetical protein